MNDQSYMRVAKELGTNSKCFSRKIGAVLVKGDSIIATGFNGPARKVPHCDHRDSKGQYKKFVVGNTCPRRAMGFGSGKGMEHCPAVHAEQNAIINAAKAGHATEGSVMYLYCEYIPCSVCMGTIINAGIKEVVVLEFQEYPDTLSSVLMAKQGGVKIRTIDE